MKLIIIFVALMVLSWAVKAENGYAMDFTYKTPPIMSINKTQIRWIRVSRANINTVCRVASNRYVWGCAQTHLLPDTCIIYAPKPLDNEDMAAMGHELLHCFGYTHD